VLFKNDLVLCRLFFSDLQSFLELILSITNLLIKGNSKMLLKQLVLLNLSMCVDVNNMGSLVSSEISCDSFFCFRMNLRISSESNLVQIELLTCRLSKFPMSLRKS
jgi:hypothetical protein